MKRSLHDLLVERVAYSPFLARLAFKALNAPRFLRFPPYRFLLRRQIEAVKRRNAAFPLVVAAENTNTCNARCVMCPYPGMNRHKGFMAMDLYRKIADECARHPGVELRLSGFGEPLLDRDLPGRIRYAKGKGIESVLITTNASLLTEDVARGLIEAGLDGMMFSVDGYDGESYEKIRTGLSFEKVIANIRRFNELRGDRRKPRTVASVILFPEYATHRKEMIRLWGSLADRVFIKPPEDWAGEVTGYKERVAGGAPHSPCPYLWTQFLITWDGVAALCCRDFCNIRIPIGEVAREGIAAIWHGATLRGLRETDDAERTLDPCHCCSYMPNWWGER